MTVTEVLARSASTMTLRCHDLYLEEWQVDFRFAGYYSERMADFIESDLASGVQPFLTCGYAEARDLYVVSDDHGTEVVLSRFSGWERIR
jgi:hypothetical protein